MAMLEVRNLSVHFATRRGVLPAVDDASFQVEAGKTLALVGESGCGKSVAAASILRLVPSPPGRVAAGQIFFEGRDILSLPMDEMRALRGSSIGMVFQEPMTSLNPVLTIGDQIAEVVRAHEGATRVAAAKRAIDLLARVRIPDPARHMGEYPHRLSGGMRQRVMIAIAIACNPALLIADEPTTALDVTTQAQILELLDDLKQSLGMAILLITHDLGIVAQHAQRVAVMYAGRIVEEANVEDLFVSPRHPYTRGLLNSLPRMGAEADRDGRPPPLPEIPGIVPALYALPPGCRFAPRCAEAIERCHRKDPRLERLTEGRSAACLRLEPAMRPTS